MDTNTLTPTVAAATLSSSLEDFEWYLSFHEEHDVKPHSGAGVGMARVAQFFLGQTDIRECVPYLINHDNVI